MFETAAWCHYHTKDTVQSALWRSTVSNVKLRASCIVKVREFVPTSYASTIRHSLSTWVRIKYNVPSGIWVYLLIQLQNYEAKPSRLGWICNIYHWISRWGHTLHAMAISACTAVSNLPLSLCSDGCSSGYLKRSFRSIYIQQMVVIANEKSLTGICYLIYYLRD